MFPEELESFGSETLVELSLFPFVRGAEFIAYAYDLEGWKSVNALYKDLPVSSEQIIHPEKYFLIREDPLLLEAPVFSGIPGFEARARGTLGEFMFYLLGKRFLDDRFARLLSEGWGNDYYEIFEHEDQRVVVILSRWDSLQDAKEFFVGIKDIAAKKYPAIQWQGIEGYAFGLDSATVEISYQPLMLMKPM